VLVVIDTGYGPISSWKFIGRPLNCVPPADGPCAANISHPRSSPRAPLRILCRHSDFLPLLPSSNFIAHLFSSMGNIYTTRWRNGRGVRRTRLAVNGGWHSSRHSFASIPKVVNGPQPKEASATLATQCPARLRPCPVVASSSAASSPSCRTSSPSVSSGSFTFIVARPRRRRLTSLGLVTISASPPAGAPKVITSRPLHHLQ